MEFDRVDALEELHVDLAIHAVAEVGSIDTLEEWLKMWQLLWKQWPERLPREKREQRKQRVQLEEQLMQLEERDLLEDQHQQRVKHMRFMMSMGPWTHSGENGLTPRIL
jgi:hypothetical protein